MKKTVTLFLASVLLCSALTGCVRMSEHTIKNTAETATDDHTSDTDFEETTLPSTEKSGFSVDFSSYDSIIAAYRKIAEYAPNYEWIEEERVLVETPNDLAQDWFEALFFSTVRLAPRNKEIWVSNEYFQSFGYVIEDLNRDGTDELVLLTSDHSVVAFFTLVNGTPKLVGNYWERKSCWIDADGLFHVNGSGGAATNSKSVYRLSPNGELILLAECGTDGYAPDTLRVVYYQIFENGEKEYISEEAFRKLQTNDFYFSQTAPLGKPQRFISLFDAEHAAPTVYDASNDAKG